MNTNQRKTECILNARNWRLFIFLTVVSTIVIVMGWQFSNIRESADNVESVSRTRSSPRIGKSTGKASKPAVREQNLKAIPAPPEPVPEVQPRVESKQKKIVSDCFDKRVYTSDQAVEACMAERGFMPVGQ